MAYNKVCLWGSSDALKPNKLPVVLGVVFDYNDLTASQETATMAKKKKKERIEKCVDCEKKTQNFYIISINSGKIIRCADCHERNVLQSVRYDSKLLDSQQINNMRQ